MTEMVARSLPLCNQVVNDASMNVGQAEVAAGVAVGELLVVEAEQVQDRGVQVVDVDRVLDGLEAELVGRAVDVAALDAAAGQPHREAVVVVVAAVDLAGVGARVRQLDRRRAAELAAPDHQRVVEQAALLQVGEQRGDGLVALAGQLAVVDLDVVVVVPRLALRRARPARSARRARSAGGRSAICRACVPGPYMSRMCFGSRLTSNASAASVCMR